MIRENSTCCVGSWGRYVVIADGLSEEEVSKSLSSAAGGGAFKIDQLAEAYSVVEARGGTMLMMSLEGGDPFLRVDCEVWGLYLVGDSAEVRTALSYSDQGERSRYSYIAEDALLRHTRISGLNPLDVGYSGVGRVLLAVFRFSKEVLPELIHRW